MDELYARDGTGSLLQFGLQLPQNEAQAVWFDTHLKPHEAMRRAWLQGRFSGRDDCGQQGLAGASSFTFGAKVEF